MCGSSDKWKGETVTPADALSRIKPGMNIFLSTGVAEPRTIIRHLISSEQDNLVDLELIQLISLGSAVPIGEYYPRKYRLKTFFSGWIAEEAITAGRVDLIPSRFSQIPRLFESGAIQVDAAIISISPPDGKGYCSLGTNIDAARYALNSAFLTIGEINDRLPRTSGNTFVHVDDFDYLIQSDESPIYFPRWPIDAVVDRLAANVAAMIEDESCISFFLGPLYEALGAHLRNKKELGIHTPFFTDALMDLIKSGAVTNRYKGRFCGRSIAAYAHGTEELLEWLDCNPVVEFHGIDTVSDPQNIGRNDRFITILPTRKIDLTGVTALHVGRGNVIAGPGQVHDFFTGAALSRGGRTIFALPSRNLMGTSNILLSVGDYPNQFSNPEALDIVVTEHGVAHMSGRTIRERALALIDVAHPDDRADLVRQAKEANILYQDQIYLREIGHLYPRKLDFHHNFGTVTVHFRALRPSDEDDMRRLFYRFSDQAIYYRYFSPIKIMPHKDMQEYVNVDYRQTMSMVGLVEIEPGIERIIAEARYFHNRGRQFANIVFIVDEKYHGMGIANFLYEFLIRIAHRRKIRGFKAHVLADNDKMRRVFDKTSFPVQTAEIGKVIVYHIPFPMTLPEDDVLVI